MFPPPHLVSRLPRYCHLRPSQFEHVIESRSATPGPAVQPGNDTGVITHALAAAVKRWNRNSYHSVTRIRRVGRSACRSHPPTWHSCPNLNALNGLLSVT